ncbi:hypothetical protein GV51_1169 [Gardnerella vaginalis 5-1]|nr:hypothetical protein GV51_1169 [Gardnerella vaginalis 5-1]
MMHVLQFCIAKYENNALALSHNYFATEPKHFNHHSKHLLTSKFQNKISYIV